MPIDRTKYPGVPEDFPIEPRLYSLTGAQPKVALVEEDGAYFAEGTSPSEVLDAYEVCEDLAQQFVDYCLKKEASNFGTHDQILQRVHSRLLTTNWCTKTQCEWVARRTAALLGWKFPD